MFFDHKTKKLTGELDYITPEESRELEQLVAEGKMTCTTHPSPEEMEELREYYASPDVQKRVADARRWAEASGRLRKVRGGRG